MTACHVSGLQLLPCFLSQTQPLFSCFLRQSVLFGSLNLSVSPASLCSVSPAPSVCQLVPFHTIASSNQLVKISPGPPQEIQP